MFNRTKIKKQLNLIAKCRMMRANILK